MNTRTDVQIDIAALLPSWQRSLRAARRSPRTVQSYTEAAEQLADFLERRGMPSAVDSIAREHVESFIEDLDTRFKPATVGVRFRSLQQLFKWALEEGEITSDPMARMRSPSVPEDPPAVLSDVELRALLKAWEGQDVSRRRDTAILRVFIDTGARLSEVANLKMADVDLDNQTLMVTGKRERIEWSEVERGHWRAVCQCGSEDYYEPVADRVRLDRIDAKTSRHAGQCEFAGETDPSVLRVLLKVSDGSGGDYWWVECGACDTAWHVPYYAESVG